MTFAAPPWARRGLLLGTLALALMGTACFKTGVDRAVPAPRGCSSDSDCSASRNEICRLATGAAMHTPDGKDAETGICVIPSSRSSRQVFLEIRPSGNTATLPVQIGPIRLDDGQNQHLTVPLPVSATGSVVTEGSMKPVGGASVHFVLTPLIPNRPQYFDVTTSSDAQTLGTFTRTLPQGSYTVEVSPSQKDGPQPLERTSNIQVSGSGQLAPLTVTAPILVHGTIQAIAEGAAQPLSGVGVQAFGATDAAMAAIDSTPPLSQVAQTDNSGTFTLALSRRMMMTPTDSSWKVHFQIAPVSPAAVFPTFIGLPDFDALTQGRFDTPLAVPGPPVTVHGAVLAADGTPVSGALVAFQTVDSSQTASGKFTYATTASSMDDGSFTATLVPADYNVVALPPPDSNSAGPSTYGLCGLTPNGNGTMLHAAQGQANPILLACESRQWTAVQIIDSSGHKIPNVVVVATRQPTPGISTNLQFQATTDHDGICWLPLVSGIYDLNAQPPAETKLPYTWAPAAIEVGDELAAPDYRRTLALGEPFELFGEIDAAGTNMPVQAIIDAYAADTTSTVLIGHGQSSADGKYSIVLPTASPVTAMPAMPIGKP